ncbi:MAG: phospholipase D-like domain-containing protein [Planctomycetota bacterium]|jgi:phosphatidylserine/phosphatidylglycerophosphate/cardiolipin synthase-like enzyme|nr:phospholipase D-like domain-containing protein [Planctomycetota bacterium]MDP6503837.1 phospholipase D-like domain-containing protein [Planctomycetota bacterium]
MDIREIDQIFKETLDDVKFSRSERRALNQVMDDIAPDEHEFGVLRSRAFTIAREALKSAHSKSVVDWLEGLMKLLVTPTEIKRIGSTEAYFSPGDECAERILDLLNHVRKQVDICVFTITDNRISDAILEAHRRSIRIRIVTDDRKSEDRGSDIEDFQKAGIHVGLDNSEKHMHHKFAIFDRTTLVTGSYNWTRTAATQNEENIVVTDDSNLVKAFLEEFEGLWLKYRSEDVAE